MVGPIDDRDQSNEIEAAMPVSTFQDKIANLSPKQRAALHSLLKAKHPIGPQRLSAFVTKDAAAPLTSSEDLQKQLSDFLPSYMVPRDYTILDTLPLTHNGKIDRKKLSSLKFQTKNLDTDQTPPKPTADNPLKSIWQKAFGKKIAGDDDFFELGGDSIMAMQIVSQARTAGINLRVTDLFKHSRFESLSQFLNLDTISPTTAESPTEVVSIFREVLGIARFQANDDFFEAGGDSITAITLVSKLRTRGYAVSVSDLFKRPTPQTLLETDEASESQDAPREQSNALAQNNQALPLTPIQEWFLDQDLNEPDHWNQSLLLRIAQQLDSEQIERSVSALYNKHASLRLALSPDGQTQKILPPSSSTSLLKRVATQGLSADELESLTRTTADEIHSSFSLKDGRLFQVALIESKGEKRLLIVAHHWCVDAISWSTLLADLETFLTSNPPNEDTSSLEDAKLGDALSALPSRAAKTIAEESEFWLSQKYSKCPKAQIEEKQKNSEKDAQTCSFRLSEQETSDLQKHASELTSDVRILLLASVSKALSHWLSSPTVLIGIEGHGREIETPENSDVVAWMTSYFPLVIDLTHANSIRECANDIRYQLAKVPNKGSNFGLIRTKLKSHTHGNPIPEPEITFNYLGRKNASFNAETLKVIDQNIGENRHASNARTSIFEINAFIQDGRFTFTWSYNPLLNATETVELLMQDVQKNLAELSSSSPYKEGSKTTAYPISDTQQSLLFHRLGKHGKDQGELNLSGEFSGSITSEDLLAAWSETAKTHPALRSTLTGLSGNTPLQTVHDTPLTEYEVLDFSKFSTQEQELQLAELYPAFKARNLDLENGPSQRLTLVRLDKERHLFLWKCHHIFLDGWSSSIVLQDVLDRANNTERDAALEQTTQIEFNAFQKWSLSQSGAEAIDFWTGYLKDCPPCLLGSPSDASDRDTVNLSLSRDVLDRIKSTASGLRVTPSVLLTAAWSITLSALTESQSVVFGYTHSTRNTELRNPHSLVANLSSTVPLRTQVVPKENLKSWLHSLLENQESVSRFGYISTARILGAMEDLESLDLFDTSLTIANYPWVKDEGGISLRNFQGDTTTQSSLSLSIEILDAIELHFDFDRDSFSKSEIGFIADTFKSTISKLLSPTRRSLAPYLTENLRTRYIGIENRRSNISEEPIPTSQTGIDTQNTQQASKAENLLIRLFCSVLSVETCDRSDDFFELGGKSIHAVRLFLRIEKAFNIKLPPSTLFTHSTVAGIASLIETGAPQTPEFKNLIPIRMGGDALPLFLIHAGGLQVLFYRDIANHFNKDRTIYGLQAIGRDGTEPPCSSIQEIATRHLSEIESVCKAGPYILVGHCFGATIAIEMANQLQAKGKQVPIIVSLDGETPHLEGDEVTETILAPKYDNSFTNYPKPLRAPRRWIRRTWKRTRRFVECCKRRIKPSYGQEAELTEKLENAIRVAFFDYRVTPYLGQVLAIRCTDSDFYANHSETAWKRAAPNSEMIQVDCTHADMLANPNAEVLAKKIESKLQSLSL